MKLVKKWDSQGTFLKELSGQTPPCSDPASFSACLHQCGVFYLGHIALTAVLHAGVSSNWLFFPSVSNVLLCLNV